MSTATISLDIGKSLDTILYPGLLHKLSKLKFSINLIKLICLLLSQRKVRVSVEGAMYLYMPRDMKAGVSQGSVLYHTLYKLYINDPPLQTTGVNLALFADVTSLHATERKEDYILRKLQRGISSVEA
jgi:hypothetical protein